MPFHPPTRLLSIKRRAMPGEKRVRHHVLASLAIILALFSSFAAPASAQRVNFAKYQKATASVHNSTYVADFAVDGIVSNFHSHRTGDRPGPKWLELSYPRSVTLASAHLYSGLIQSTTTQIYQNFNFQYHDGLAWIDIPGSSVTGNTSPEANVIFSAPVTSTRFRLHSTDNGSRSIRQLAFFPPNPVGDVEQGFPIGTDVTLNLAYKRPATSSSASLGNEFGPGYAKNAFDGYIDDKSRWLCTSASGEWLEVDLLADHAIGSAHVHTGFIGTSDPRQTSQPMPDFKLQSWNGSDWLDIPGAAITGNNQVSRAVEFSETVTTSRVRIVTTSAFNGRVQELLLFPPRVGGYELGREVINAPPPTDSWLRFEDFARGIRCNPDPSTDRRLGLVNGTVVFAGGGAGNAALRWQLLYNYRNNTYRIRHVATGKCLAMANISKQSGTPVIVEDYSAMPHQEWILDPVVGKTNHFRVINAYSGLALRTQGSWNINTPMVVVTVNPDAATQHWFSQGTPVHYPKKGIAATGNVPDPPLADPNASWMEYFYSLYRDSSWSYSWGRNKTTDFPFMGTHHAYNPMQWGAQMNHGLPQIVLDRLRPDLHSNPNPVSVMGFNEPDGSGQANMTVETAIARWPRLEAMEMPLVSPGPINAPNPWLTNFYQQADSLGFRVEYTNVHWYKAPNSAALINDLLNAYNTYGRPIWLTEFSVVRWEGNATWTHADNFNFLAEFLWRAESLPWLKRYSLFNFRKDADGPNQSANDPAQAPRSNALNADGTLTPFGELYATWDGLASVLEGRAYHLHNKLRYLRVSNPGSGEQITSATPATGSGADQWFLTPGTSENTVRITSTMDGRRLRYFTGTHVGLAAATNTQLQTEWRLVPVVSGANHDGWYFINHPDTNHRLRIDNTGALQVGAGTPTGDDYRWRFVIPMAPQSVSPPAAPVPAAQPAVTEIALSWPAIAGAETYTVHRATSAEGPWQQMATGLAGTSWSNTGLPYETQYFYTVTATNGLGSSPPSDPFTATTLHPYSSFATWQLEKLSGVPQQDQAPGADPDQDGKSNLLEFAFLTDPVQPGGSPFIAKEPIAGTLTLEFPWNWRAQGLTWQLRHGQDLGNIAAWPVVPPGTTTATREGDIDRIIITPAMAYPGHGFYVLEVNGN